MMRDQICGHYSTTTVRLRPEAFFTLRPLNPPSVFLFHANIQIIPACVTQDFEFKPRNLAIKRCYTSGGRAFFTRTSCIRNYGNWHLETKRPWLSDCFMHVSTNPVHLTSVTRARAVPWDSGEHVDCATILEGQCSQASFVILQQADLDRLGFSSSFAPILPKHLHQEMVSPCDMDPVTAFGLAAGVVQFVQFSNRLLNSSVKIYIASNPSLVQEESLDTLCARLKDLSTKLSTAPHGISVNVSQNDGHLHDLAASCQKDCDTLLAKLMDLRSRSGHRRFWKSIREALKDGSGMTRDSFCQLQDRLKTYESSMSLHMCASLM